MVDVVDVVAPGGAAPRPDPAGGPLAPPGPDRPQEAAGADLLAEVADLRGQVADLRGQRDLLAEAVVDAAVLLRPSGDVIYATPGFQQLLGWSPARGRAPQVHPDDEPALRRVRADVLAGRTQEAASVLRIRHREGHWVWVEERARAVYGPGGEVAAVALTMRDASARLEEEQRLRSRERFFRRLAENSPSAIVVWRRGQGVVYASPGVARVLGWAPSMARGIDVVAPFVHPDDRDALEEAYARAAADPHASSRLELRLRHADGRWVWAEQTFRGVVDPDTGRVSDVQVSTRDVGARREAEEARRAADARWRAAFDHSPVGQALLGVDGVPRAVNDELRRILGRPPARTEGVSLLEFVEDTDRPAAAEVLRAAWAGLDAPDEADVRVVRGDSSRTWVRLSVAAVPDGAGGTDCLAAQVIDIDELVRTSERLRHDVAHDPLTGLANRPAVLEEIGQALARCRRHGGRVAVCFLDLDGFKEINDSLGHATGDAVLVAVAARLRRIARSEDLVGRIGGDEFVVVVHPAGDAGALRQLADRFCDAFRAPLPVGGEPLVVTVSVGVAVSGPASDVAELVGRADAAMYAAKHAGGGLWRRAPDPAGIPPVPAGVPDPRTAAGPAPGPAAGPAAGTATGPALG